MTKRNMQTQSNAKNERNTNNHAMRNTTRKANAKKRDNEPRVTLRSIFDDIVRDNKNTTLTTKKMRVKLRATFANVHDKNDAWTFAQSQYDDVRSMFDANYRARIERARKRNTKKTNAKKNDANTNVETNVKTNDVENAQ